MPSVYLLLGSNEGNSLALLESACEAISKGIGEISQSSSIYRTEAWGKTDQNDFLNQAVCVKTRKWPKTVLKLCLDIEKQLGRMRIEKWDPRTIDIDILFYGNKVINTDQLVVPHPQFEYRNFAIIPMMEIAPEFEHPINKKSIEELYKESEDELSVYAHDTK